MKNLKLKLTLVMITTTVFLFLITFFSINYYQKNYIFDKAISSLENEVEYFKNYEEPLLDDKERFFNVEILFLENYYESNYLNKIEKFFQEQYKEGKLNYDTVEKISNDYGEYYVLITKVPNDTEAGNDDLDKDLLIEPSEISVIFYTDITLSSNIVNKINTLFFILLVIMIIVEGLVGIFLGSRLENSQIRLKHFFQNASHELKSPLMSIQGFAEGIKTGVVEDNVMASDIIIRKSEKMKLLVDEILNISKLDSKEYILKKEAVDIRDIVEESVETYRSILDEKKLLLNLEITDKSTEITADALQIYKAINTVIDNAFKFAKSKVDIKVYIDKNFLHVDVFNDCSNLNDEHARHIFDRFYSSSSFSTGIGLAMAKEILNLSNGDILFQNVKDGVVFKIKIPKK